MSLFGRIDAPPINQNHSSPARPVISVRGMVESVSCRIAQVCSTNSNQEGGSPSSLKYPKSSSLIAAGPIPDNESMAKEEAAVILKRHREIKSID
jgi:hypothetical protein